MNNNDILRRLRFALRIDDDELLKMLNHARGSSPPTAKTAAAARGRGKQSSPEATITVRSRRWQMQDLPALLARSDDADFRACPDAALESFLDALIVQQRGPRDPAHGKPSPERGAAPDQSPLRNNDILKKLRIAFAMRDDALRQCLRNGGVEVSKSELSALFRQPDHRNYQRCGDQVIRACLQGLTLQLRPEAVAAGAATEAHGATRAGAPASRHGQAGKPGSGATRRAAAEPVSARDRVVKEGQGASRARSASNERGGGSARTSNRENSARKDRSVDKDRSAGRDRGADRDRITGTDRNVAKDQSAGQNRSAWTAGGAGKARGMDRDRGPTRDRAATNNRSPTSERSTAAPRGQSKVQGVTPRRSPDNRSDRADTASGTHAAGTDTEAKKPSQPWLEAARNRDAARRSSDNRSDQEQRQSAAEKPHPGAEHRPKRSPRS